MIRASLQINHASRLTMAQRRRIAAWLQARARLVISSGDLFAKRFRAKLYEMGKKRSKKPRPTRRPAY